MTDGMTVLYARDRVSELTQVPGRVFFAMTVGGVDGDSADDVGFESLLICARKEQSDPRFCCLTKWTGREDPRQE